jgi:hypothetical protein
MIFFSYPSIAEKITNLRRHRAMATTPEAAARWDARIADLEIEAAENAPLLAEAFPALKKWSRAILANPTDRGALEIAAAWEFVAMELEQVGESSAAQLARENIRAVFVAGRHRQGA